MARKIYAVVPAAGQGTRMGNPIPKQYLKIQNTTILEYTLRSLLVDPDLVHIILVTQLSDAYLADIALLSHSRIALVQGGQTRAESVLAGLTYIKKQCITPLDKLEDIWVMVHDAARPCLHPQDIQQLKRITHEQGAILACPLTDTIKRSDPQNRICNTEDRSELWRALTPQFFNLELLWKAIEDGIQHHLPMTDEASAMELQGFKPQLLVGRSDNIKITYPEDLALAEFYLTKHKKEEI